MRRVSLLLLGLTLGVGLSSCSDSPSDPIDPGPELGEHEVGEDGGEVSFESGVILEVPAGALSLPVEFTLEITDGQNPVGDDHQVGQLYLIGPTGTVFDEPVRIQIPLPAGYSGNIDELLLLTRHGAGQAFATGDIQRSVGEISGTTLSLSPFWASETGGEVVEFEVSPSTVEMGGGEEVTLTASALNLAGEPVPGATVEWNSDEPEVAAVSEEGVITGGQVGEAVVTGTVQDHTDTVLVTVVAGAPTTLEVSPSEAGIQVGKTVGLTAVARDVVGNEVPDPAISWSSDDEAVAVVDEEGEVLGVAAGSTVVRATSGAVEGSSTVFVSDADPAEVVIVGLPNEVPSGDTLTLNAQVLDANGGEIPGAVVTWSVSDANVLELVASDRVHANSVGSVQITATAAEGVSSTHFIEVVPGEPHVIELSPTNPVVPVGETLGLSAEVRDRNGNVVPAGIAWSSADEAIAAVSGAGVVTGVSEGSAEITAQVETIQAFVTVEVTDDAESLVTFADPLVEGAVRAALDQPEGDILASDVAALTRISFAGISGITDLGGLEYATGVAALSLLNQEITDLAPLAGLTQLELLNLRNNNISDITPLAGLTELWALSLDGNNVSDISTLEGLLQLRNLFLIDNPVSDLAPIAGATGMTNFGVSNTGVSDLSVVHTFTDLEFLYIGGLGLTDAEIQFVEGLASLRFLWFEDNQITDLSPVETLTGLTNLNLAGNQVSDLSPVAGLTALTSLRAPENNLTSAAGVENLTFLTSLVLSQNQITDLQPILDNAGLGAGNSVSLLGNPLSEAARCVQIPELQARGVNVNFVGDPCDE